MSEQANILNVVLAVYPNRGYADAAVTYLHRLDASNLLHFHEVAVVIKDVNGRITVAQIGQPTAGRGARRGAIAGALISLVFPAGLIGSAIFGAGVGGVIGRLRGRSGHGAALQMLGDQVDRGKSGVIVLAGDDVVEQVVERLTGCDSLHRLRVDALTLMEVSEKEMT